MRDLEITDVVAIACSVSLREPVRLGLGSVVKRESVIVKVTTHGGIVGYGEAHHARAPRAIATIVNDTMRDLIIGMDASETTQIWDRIYLNHLATHGTGAAGASALSGIDIALWDIRGKALGVPIFQLLGGSAKWTPSYAGGISLGYQEPAALIDEIDECLKPGYSAVKLRIGDTVKADAARIRAVRERFGDDLMILTDANAQYSVADTRAIMPLLRELEIGWLEEPFAPHDVESYRMLAAEHSVPIAAGENHYTRFEVQRLIDQRIVSILQPDVSKTGGITEMMRIAATASTLRLPMCPHTSVTGINMAATAHLLASMPTAQYFEADIARENPFRTDATSVPYQMDHRGRVRPTEGPGLGIDVDEEFVKRHPMTPGPAFVPGL